MKRKLLFILFFTITFLTQAQQWEIALPDSIRITNGFIDNNNITYYVGCSPKEGTFTKGALIKVFDDGQYELKTFPDNDEKHLSFIHITSLTNGSFFVVGRKCVGSLSNPGELTIIILDGNYQIVYEQTIQAAEGFDGFWGGHAVVDDDGTIVLFASVMRPNPYSGVIQYIGVMFRFAQDGECLNYQYLTSTPPAPLCYINQITDLQLINDPYNNHTIVLCPGRGGLESILHFDYDFNLLNDFIINDPNPQWETARLVSYAQSDYWYNENEMLIVCQQIDSIQENHNHPHILIGYLNREGEISEQIQINKQDTLMYPSQWRNGMAYANDSTIYVLAKCNTEDWLEPYYPQIYLINRDLEILGTINLWDKINYWPTIVYAKSDYGCILVSLKMSETTGGIDCYKVQRFSREDFQPVWSIKERPEQEILSSVYPNPTTNEIHFDLTNIPMDGSVRLRITNITGQTFLDRKVYGTGNLLTVGVTTLPTGTYTYCLYQKDKILTKGKFIKN